MCHNTHIKMFHESSSVFSLALPEEEFTERVAQPHAVWDHFILNADNVNCKHCDCVLKYNNEHHEKPVKEAHSAHFRDMKQPTKYNDPKRNYGGLMIIWS